MIYWRLTAIVGLCLLVAGSTRGGEDVQSAPRMVELELLIAETSQVAASQTGDLDLSTPADKLRTSLLELEKQGKLDSLARVRLASLENLTASIQVGESTAVVTGRMTMRAGGPVSTAVSERQTGLLVSATARCQDDRQIVTELNFEHSRLVPRQAAEAKDADAVLPPQTGTSTLKTTVLIPEGQTVVVGGMGAQTNNQKTLLVVLATARVLDKPGP